MKGRSIKKALTTSIISIFLCLAMFIGSTFAWFTGSASTAVNKIETGTLDVELWDDVNDVKLGEDPLKWVKAPGHESEDVLWEPGVSYDLESFRIKNNGKLALKYKILISGVVGNNDSVNLLDVINFSATVGEETNVENIKTWVGELAAEAVTDKITITGTMDTIVGNEYQGLSIDSVYITVIATQNTVEYDSDGNTYDNYAQFPDVEVSSIADVNNVIKEGSNILILNSDINADMNTEGVTKTMDDTGCVALYFNKENTPNMAETITIDGSKTVKLLSTGMAVWAHHGANIVINGGVYDNSTVNSGWQLIYANNDSTITVNGGTFIANTNGELFNTSNQSAGGGGTIIIKGGLYNKPLIPNEGSTVNGWQASDTYNETTGKGIKIADGYHYESVTIDGATWYQVVKNTTTD